jgi:hypothetical protein
LNFEKIDEASRHIPGLTINGYLSFILITMKESFLFYYIYLCLMHLYFGNNYIYIYIWKLHITNLMDYDLTIIIMWNLIFINSCRIDANVIHLFVLFKHRCYAQCLNTNIICLFVLFKYKCYIHVVLCYLHMKIIHIISV